VCRACLLVFKITEKSYGRILIRTGWASPIKEATLRVFMGSL